MLICQSTNVSTEDMCIPYLLPSAPGRAVQYCHPQSALNARPPRWRLHPLLSPAEVAHDVPILAIGAMRCALTVNPKLRRNIGAGKAVVLAETASVPAAINARAAEGRDILGEGSHGHRDRASHCWRQGSARPREGSCEGRG